MRLTKRTFAIFGGSSERNLDLGRLRPTVGRVGALTEMSKRPRSDYETGDDATRAGLDPKSDGGGLLAEYIPCRTFQGSWPGYYFKLDAKGPGYYLDKRARSGRTSHAAAIGAVAADGAAASDAALMPPPKPRAPGPAVQLDPDELLARAEREAFGGDERLAEQNATLDEKGLRRMVLAFERRYAANQTARLKHADEPDKFVDSEVDLDEEIKRLGTLAGYPELYPEFCRLNAVPSILALLSHDNPDIACDALVLLNELTDADAVESSEEGGAALVASVKENSGYELIYECLERFGGEASPEDQAAIGNALGIVENCADIDVDAAADFCAAAPKLLKWLLKRIGSKKPTDNNKLAAAEVLAILVQTSDENKKRVGELGGIDALLRAVAPFKGKDPADEGEREVLENIFDALVASTMETDNKRAFVENEGLELMLMMMKSKRSCRTSAIKCVDYALTRCPAACERFVDILGLKTAFSVFMGKGFEKLRKSAGLEAVQEEEERAVSVVSSLFLHLAKGSERYNRLCAKFVEDEHAKCDRLAELWAKYSNRVKAVDARLETRTDDIELTPDDLYVERLGGGLYTLELLSLIFASVFATGHAGIRQRLLLQMELHAGGGGDDDEAGADAERVIWSRLRSVRNILETHAENIGGADGEEERVRRRAHVVKLLVAIGGGRPEGEEEAKAAE